MGGRNVVRIFIQICFILQSITDVHLLLHCFLEKSICKGSLTGYNYMV